jgi:hypothetical protein
MKKITITMLLIFVLFIFLLGCTKKTDDIQTDKTKQTDTNTSIDGSSLQESDDDISSVDYKVFYDELSIKGEWVEVSSKELGLINGSMNYAKDIENKESFFSKMLGIKTANAEVQTDAGAYFVWRPSTELAVSVNAGEPPVYKPYSNGQWINTEDGWYFKAPTPAEEITSHYGRWTQNDRLGWLWVPGRVWSPAWVDWRENDDYVAWTPVPPHVYLSGSTLNVPAIDDENKYVIIEKKNFTEPQLYKYMYLENKNKIMIKEMKKVDGVMIVNRTVINKGPEVSVIEKKTGKTIEKVKLNKSDNRNDVKYTSDAITVYAPKLKKVKAEKNNEPVSKPQKTVKFNEVTSGVNEMNKKEEKTQEKELKKETKDKEKEIKKEEKQNEKEINKENKEHGKDKGENPKNKKGDDSEMKQGKDKEKGNNDDKGNKDKGKK